MFQYKCLNPIAQVGLDRLPDSFKEVEDIQLVPKQEEC